MIKPKLDCPYCGGKGSSPSVASGYPDVLCPGPGCALEQEIRREKEVDAIAYLAQRYDERQERKEGE